MADRDVAAWKSADVCWSNRLADWHSKRQPAAILSNESHKLSPEDHEVVSRAFALIKSRLTADAYGWDGAIAQEIRSWPVGLRAMAATHHLDISLILDDIGWHFLNFGHPSHVEETELGLRELGLPEVAAMFREAYEIMRPTVDQILRQGRDYRVVLEETDAMRRIDELTDLARQAIGSQGVYRHWADYAKKHPDRVFDS